ncbi:MAG: D-alanyl-D-alanine carboxypeptidase, partial [Pseudomonadota bacterium]
TAAYALEHLGPSYRFETRLSATGPVEAGVLRGDLVLAGGGDPELDTDALAPLAAALHTRGIRRVAGQLVTETGPFGSVAAIAPSQPEDAPYNPSVSGLNLNFNRVRVEWPRRAGKAAIRVTAPARNLRPNTDAVRMEPVAGLGRALRHVQRKDREVWQIDTAALRRSGGRWLPVRRPAVYAGQVFADLAAVHGVERPSVVSPEVDAAGIAQQSGTLIARHRSRPLAAILADMLYHSTNLTAEVVGVAASAEAPGQELQTAPGSLVTVAAGPRAAALAGTGRAMLASSADLLNRWAAGFAGFEAGDPGFRLRNHSGLTTLSRVSPERMVDFLRAAGRRPSPLPKSDPWRPGGVAQLLRPHNVAVKSEQMDYARMSVVAKTGTMNFVRGLAGYVKTPTDRRLAFAIFSNDLAARRGARRIGPRAWIARARGLERALIRSWVRMADAEPLEPVEARRAIP